MVHGFINKEVGSASTTIQEFAYLWNNLKLIRQTLNLAQKPNRRTNAGVVDKTILKYHPGHTHDYSNYRHTYK